MLNTVNGLCIMTPIKDTPLDFNLVDVCKAARENGFFQGWAHQLENCVPYDKVMGVAKIWADGNVLYQSQDGDARIPVPNQGPRPALAS